MPKLRRDLLVLWSFWITTVQFSFSLTKNKETNPKREVTNLLSTYYMTGTAQSIQAAENIN
jgi:hypothetical protein